MKPEEEANPIDAFVRVADRAWEDYQNERLTCAQAGMPYEEFTTHAANFIALRYPDFQRALPLVIVAMANGDYDPEILRKYLEEYGRKLNTTLDEQYLCEMHVEYILLYRKYKSRKERNAVKRDLANSLMKEREMIRNVHKEYEDQMRKQKELDKIAMKKRIAALIEEVKRGPVKF